MRGILKLLRKRFAQRLVFLEAKANYSFMNWLREFSIFTQYPHHLCYFFSTVERSVLMALVVRNKDILEKVAMQRTQQFGS